MVIYIILSHKKTTNDGILMIFFFLGKIIKPRLFQSPLHQTDLADLVH